MWVFSALLSAIFAALTAILAKIGIKNVDSNLATAIRTVVIILFAWSIVLAQGTAKQIGSISRFSMLFLILSGVTTGLSWLFYFHALKIGPVAQVATIDKLSLAITVVLAAVVLHERITLSALIGVTLMIAGALFIAVGK